VIHVCDDAGEELPTGQTGTIYFGEGKEFTYHGDAKKTAETRHPKGWTTLGDVGYVNEGGYLFLTDRKAYMIISGGVNIYPQEVEDLLVTHPKVLDAAVFGIPNEDFGEEVKAVVQLRNPADANDATAQELIEFCRQNLSNIKAPKTLDFMDELPRHPTGKLYKRLLRDPYWAGRASSIV
jgi:long-chain acyl-CoA synthetase